LDLIVPQISPILSLEKVSQDQKENVCIYDKFLIKKVKVYE